MFSHTIFCDLKTTRQHFPTVKLITLVSNKTISVDKNYNPSLYCVSHRCCGSLVGVAESISKRRQFL